MKVKLAWRIGLLPVAVLILPFFMVGGAVLGSASWWAALKDFWEGKL